MGLSKKVIVKVALVFFLMAFTASVEARFDPSTFLAQAMIDGDPNYITKSTTTACCDNCMCTKSNPPQCVCHDIGETCHSACKLCICVHVWPLLPLQCNCADITNFCYDSCSSTAKPRN